MNSLYDNTGLTTDQVGYLDSLGDFHQEIAARGSRALIGTTYSFNVKVAEMLEARGADMTDPSIFAAVVTGAALLEEFMELNLPDNTTVRATGSLVIGAMLATRPLRSVE